MPQPMSRYAAVAAAVTVTVVGSGVRSVRVTPLPEARGSGQATRPTEAPPDPAAQETADATSTAFCDEIADEAVTTAVGGSALESAYGDGERTALEPDLVDVSH